MKAKQGAEKIWLNSEIKFLFSKKHVIVEEISNLESILSQNLNYDSISFFKSQVQQVTI